MWVILVATADLLKSDSQPATNAPAATRLIEVRGVISEEDTFDGLPMDSALPAPWTVRGDGTARIVPLPTSVDRSIRITSSTSGAATAACRPTGVGASSEVRIALDYRLGRDAPGPFPLLSLHARGASQVTLIVDPRGAPISVVGANGAPGDASQAPATGAGSGGTPAPAGWHRLELTILPSSGAVTWRAHDTSGAETGSGTASLTNLASATFDGLCLLSPGASPSGWIAVDDLVIQG